MQTTLTILSLLLYLLGGGLLLFRLLGKDILPVFQKKQILLLTLVALSLHTIVLLQAMFTPAGLDIGFFNVLSLVAWLVALLLTLAALNMQVECLGVIVFPFAALILLVTLLPTQHHVLGYDMPAGIQFHILISILAYSILSIAAVQASLLYVQDAQLHNKHPGGLSVVSHPCNHGDPAVSDDQHRFCCAWHFTTKWRGLYRRPVCSASGPQDYPLYRGLESVRCPVVGSLAIWLAWQNSNPLDYQWFHIANVGLFRQQICHRTGSGSHGLRLDLTAMTAKIKKHPHKRDSPPN